MKYLITLLAFLSSAFALVPPQPTKTIEQVPSIQTQATPTQQPERYAYKWSKRDVDDTLSMYENWANDCNDDDSNVNIAVSGGVNNLWQTVTNTVYCGNGNVKTVTKTVTAKATETATASKGVGGGKKSKDSCDAKCWSTYLWHTYGYGISVAQGFTGIVCMLIGLYFMIFGFFSFRITLALTGFVFFAVMTWIGLVNNEPLYGYPHNEVVYIVVSASLGLIGAFLFVFIYFVCLYFIGGLGGFFLAVFILSWKASLVIQIQVARICFIVGLGVVLGIFIILAEAYCVLFCTAFIGAYLFMLGLDLFIHTGMINAFLLIFDGNKNHTNVYIMRTPVYVMLAFVIVLLLGSMGWQYYWNIISLKRAFGVNIEEKAPEKK